MRPQEPITVWREYTAADFGETFSLIRGDGMTPKYIVMKEDGDLLVYRKDTREASGIREEFLHDLPRNYPHYGPSVAVDALQTAAFIVYW